jgi:hypothetical protein
MKHRTQQICADFGENSKSRDDSHAFLGVGPKAKQPSPVRHFGFTYVASLRLRRLAVRGEYKRMLTERWFIGLE